MPVSNSYACKPARSVVGSKAEERVWRFLILPLSQRPVGTASTHGPLAPLHAGRSSLWNCHTSVKLSSFPAQLWGTQCCMVFFGEVRSDLVTFFWTEGVSRVVSRCCCRVFFGATFLSDFPPALTSLVFESGIVFLKVSLCTVLSRASARFVCVCVCV